MRSRRQLDHCANRGRDGSAGRPGRCPGTRSRRRRTACGGLLLAATLLVAPGCQLNRSFFQMDSNSKVPFFGIDLAPKWPGRESSVDGVSRLQSETAHRSQPPATVAETAPPPKSLALPLSASVVTRTATDGTPVETFR